LRDDLAADQRRVEGVVLAIESRLGVRVAGALLDEVRTYGDLVAAAVDAVRATRDRLARESAPVASARIRVRAASGSTIERAGPLTPYLIEAVREDARRAGVGATVSILVTGHSSDVAIEHVARRLEGLVQRGVGVRIARDAGVPAVA
jgi:hypothetical protein